jgi:hypothetical protein
MSQYFIFIMQLPIYNHEEKILTHIMSLEWWSPGILENLTALDKDYLPFMDCKDIQQPETEGK